MAFKIEFVQHSASGNTYFQNIKDAIMRVSDYIVEDYAVGTEYKGYVKTESNNYLFGFTSTNTSSVCKEGFIVASDGNFLLVAKNGITNSMDETSGNIYNDIVNSVPSAHRYAIPLFIYNYKNKEYGFEQNKASTSDANLEAIYSQLFNIGCWGNNVYIGNDEYYLTQAFFRGIPVDKLYICQNHLGNYNEILVSNNKKYKCITGMFYYDITDEEV